MISRIFQARGLKTKTAFFYSRPCWQTSANREDFCVGFPTQSQRQRYLFIYLSTNRSARHMISSLGVSTWEDWVPVYWVFMFGGRPLLFSAVVILLSLNWRFHIVLLVHKVSRSRFPFWRFLWVYLSLNFLYKLKFWLQNIPIDRQKPITFPFFFTCVLSNLRLSFWYFFRAGLFKARLS